MFVKASRDGEVLEKSWSLPKNIHHDGVSAKLGDDNELTIVLPKLPEKPKVSAAKHYTSAKTCSTWGSCRQGQLIADLLILNGKISPLKAFI